jgi:predicted Holliday junction resolvase-like endonuclease
MEIIAFISIIILIASLYFQSQYKNNVSLLSSENKLLKTREDQLNTTISELNASLKREQEIIQERKIELDKKEKGIVLTLNDLEIQLAKEKEAKKKVTSQKKSSEVRLGHIAETLAPFLDQFEFDPEACTFLGKPIDYISFGEEEITFIEVKSGNSQLNNNQRRVRDLIKDKKVGWKEIRIK